MMEKRLFGERPLCYTKEKHGVMEQRLQYFLLKEPGTKERFGVEICLTHADDNALIDRAAMGWLALERSAAEKLLKKLHDCLVTPVTLEYILNDMELL